MKILHRVARMALVATVAAGGFATVAPEPAHAAGCADACITNIVKSPATDKVTISWKTTVPAKARLRLEKDGVEVARVERTTFLTSHSLTTPAVLKPSTQYKFYLRATDQAGRVKVVSGFTTTKAAPVLTGCALDCITSLSAGRRGGSLDFNANTTVPGSVTIKVATLGGTVVNSVTKNVPMGPWTVNVGGLKAATTYNYSVAMTDMAGKVRTETGSATTLRRRLTVEVWKIDMIDDSDSGGAGEFDIDGRINGGTPVAMYNARSISSGNAVFPTFSMQLMDAPLTSTFELSVIDDDCDLFDNCAGALTPKWNNGTSEAADWTAMSTSFSAHADVSTPKTEWAMGVSGVIDYAVYGYYTIDYVA